MKKIFNHFEKELWLVIIFIIGSALIVNPYFYSLLVLSLLVSLYFFSRNLIKSTWLTFIPVYLFYRAVYFTTPWVFQTGFWENESNPAPVTYFISYSDPLLILLLILLCFHQRHLKTAVKINRNLLGVIIAMVLIVSWGIVSSWFSRMAAVSYFYLFQLVKFFVVFLISVALVNYQRIGKTTLEIILLFVLFNSGLIVLQKINGGPLGLPIESPNLFTQYGRFADESPGLYRPGGITTGPNEMATVIGLALPILMSLGITKNNFNQTFIWICLGFAALALMFTAARAVWFLMLIILPLVYRRTKTLPDRFSPPAAKYAFLILIGLGIIFMPIIVQRFLSVGQLIKPGGGAIYRLRHLAAAGEIMKANPLGVGMNVFQYAIAEQFEPEFIFYDSTPAHNVFAEVGADFGPAGIVLFLLLFYFMIKSAMTQSRAANPISVGVLGSLIVYLALLQVHPWLFERSASSLFWLLGGYYYVKSG